MTENGEASHAQTTFCPIALLRGGRCQNYCPVFFVLCWEGKPKDLLSIPGRPRELARRTCSDGRTSHRNYHASKNRLFILESHATDV